MRSLPTGGVYANGVRKKRYVGPRNEHFNDWHRDYASKRPSFARCYMTDLDCVEYRRGREAVALIEVKLTQGARAGESQKKLLKDLAGRAGLPLFVVNYWWDDENDLEAYHFKVSALNDLGREVLAYDRQMSAQEYAEFLEAL